MQIVSKFSTRWEPGHSLPAQLAGLTALGIQTRVTVRSRRQEVIRAANWWIIVSIGEKVRRGKALDFSGCNSRPGTGSLHPVTIETAAEATKLSELSV